MSPIGRTLSVPISALVCVLAMTVSPAGAQVGCENWDDPGEFFRTADLEQVQFCLAEGADANVRDDRNEAALHHALRREDNEAIVRALIEAGADVNASDDRGQAPLHYVGHYDASEAVVRILIDAGADVNARQGARGYTPLHTAAASTQGLVIARLLIEAGANVNSRDSHGITPLHQAARTVASLGMVDLLIEAGADVDARTNVTNATPLHYASGPDERLPNVRALVNAGADVNAQDSGGESPLHGAAWSVSGGAIMRELLTAGAEIDIRSNVGKTPLHSAAGSTNKPAESVEILAEFGADLDAIDARGLMPLHYAFDDGDVELVATATSGDNVETDPNSLSPFDQRRFAIIEALVAAGADVNARDPGSRTPLHLALMLATGLHEGGIIGTLIDAGADVNAAYTSGATPLHYAARYDRTGSIVTALIGAGADTNAPDNWGRTPLHVAVRYSVDDAEISEILIRSGADVNAQADDQTTPLHHAVSRLVGLPIDSNQPLERVVEVLIAEGAEVDARNVNGATPLLEASRFGYSPRVVELLVEGGADINARYPDTGSSVLHVMPFIAGDELRGLRVEDHDAEFSENTLASHLAVFDALIASGGLVDARDSYALTPLHVAALNSMWPGAIDALLDAGADPRALTGDQLSAWDLIQENELLVGTSAFERLRETGE